MQGQAALFRPDGDPIADDPVRVTAGTAERFGLRALLGLERYDAQIAEGRQHAASELAHIGPDVDHGRRLC